MTGVVGMIASAVPVPNPELLEGLEEPEWVDQGIQLLILIGVVSFCVMMLTMQRRVARRGRRFGPAVLGVPLAALPWIVIGVVMFAQTWALSDLPSDPLAELDERRGRLAVEVTAELEQAFGVTYVDGSPDVPLDNGEYSQNRMVLPDGSTAECVTVADDDGFYRIRCGGVGPEDGVELVPVTP